MLDAPLPYFGGKRRVADDVWARFGDVANYVEPFLGSAAMLLARPGGASGIETVNDADGMVSNFWRAIAATPEEVAHHADWPVIENDLHARHLWLVERRENLTDQLEANPDFYDAKAAGWWCLGMCCWIGSGWCSGSGPWRVVDGRLVKGASGKGLRRPLPHLGGHGVGNGINRQLPHLGTAGAGVHRKSVALATWFADLSARLRRVRVCSGDWRRVTGPSVIYGSCAIFLDPPYSIEAGRDNALYHVESGDVAHEVREWALEVGRDRNKRIALCGYVHEHEDLMAGSGWTLHRWKTKGGYAGQSDEENVNASAEAVWFSPGCLSARQLGLFAQGAQT